METFETSYGYYGNEPLEWASIRGMYIDPALISFEVTGESFPQYARHVKRQVFYAGEATPYYVMCSRNSIEVIGLELPFISYQHEEYILGDSLCILSRFDDPVERLVDYMQGDIRIQEEKTSVGLRYCVTFPKMYESARFKIPSMYLLALQSDDYSELSQADINKLDAFESRVFARYPSLSHWKLPGTLNPSDKYMEIEAIYEVSDRK